MIRLTPLAAALLLPLTAIAAPSPLPPDAGQLLREQQRPLEAPSAGVTLTLPEPGSAVVSPGGMSVMLQAVTFSGNTVFSQAELAGVTGPVRGREFDLAGMYALADKVSAHYRAQGYAFAKAFVPASGLKDGVLNIVVIEGAFGRRALQGVTGARAEQAERFLADLKPGDVIQGDRLERHILILGDQPGYKPTPLLKPGEKTGTGDLDVKLERKAPVSGNVSLSNFGNRYTGYQQLRGTVNWDSPFRFGDQIGLSVMQSDKNLQMLGLNYSAPIGGSGLRALAGVSVTRYELAREFTSLIGSGTAQTTYLGLSYPLVRSLRQNLSVSLTAQDKRFYDEQLKVNARQWKNSDSGVLTLNFDRRDGRGLTYGNVSYTGGYFSGVPGVADSARTNGRFGHVNVEVVRLQTLSDRLSLYARMSGQLANSNLDGSEAFVLGGPYGVRAYATGEGIGNEGLLTQVEVRYARDGLSPYAFYDQGHVRLQHNPTVPGVNGRSLSGAGIGIRYQWGPWSLDTLLARRLHGGVSQTDPTQDAVRLWLTVSYAF